MERTIPISIAVRGHPAIASVALSWSAPGMIPQALQLGTEGGIAEAAVTQQNCELVNLQYRAKIDFKHPTWGIIELHQEKLVAPDGAQIVLDPGAWIRSLTLQLQVNESNFGQPDPRSNYQLQNHLIVNLIWHSPNLDQTQKESGRITPKSPVQFVYLQDPEAKNTSATLSGFGVIEGKLMHLAAQSIDLQQDSLLLLATPNGIQLN